MMHSDGTEFFAMLIFCGFVMLAWLLFAAVFYPLRGLVRWVNDGG